MRILRSRCFDVKLQSVVCLGDGMTMVIIVVVGIVQFNDENDSGIVGSGKGGSVGSCVGGV